MNDRYKRSIIYKHSYPNKNPQIHGKPMRKYVIVAIMAHSTIQGTRPSFIVDKANLFKAFGSKSSPARISIITNAIFLYIKNQKIKISK